MLTSGRIVGDLQAWKENIKKKKVSTVKENANNKQKEGVSNIVDITTTNKFHMPVNEEGQTKEDKEGYTSVGSGGGQQDPTNTKKWITQAFGRQDKQASSEKWGDRVEEEEEGEIVNSQYQETLQDQTGDKIQQITERQEKEIKQTNESDNLPQDQQSCSSNKPSQVEKHENTDDKVVEMDSPQSNLAIVEANPKPIAIISQSGTMEVPGESQAEITLYTQAPLNKALHSVL